jgi:hypothetical protein
MATYAEAQAAWLKVYRITERERAKVRITKLLMTERVVRVQILYKISWFLISIVLCRLP